MNQFYKDIPLHVYQDFPKEGVGFLDVFPLLNRGVMDNLGRDLEISSTIILLPEARSFCMFHALKKKDNYVIPLRKSGKLPGELFDVSYRKEYGTDTLHFCIDHFKDAIEMLSESGALDKFSEDKVIPVAIVDDVLATGGTASAMVEAINSFRLDGCPYSFHVDHAAFLIEIPFLKGREMLEKNYGVRVNSLIESE